MSYLRHFDSSEATDGWNSRFVMSHIPEYNALNDRYCKFWKKKHGKTSGRSPQADRGAPNKMGWQANTAPAYGYYPQGVHGHSHPGMGGAFAQHQNNAVPFGGPMLAFDSSAPHGAPPLGAGGHPAYGTLPAGGSAGDESAETLPAQLRRHSLDAPNRLPVVGAANDILPAAAQHPPGGGGGGTDLRRPHRAPRAGGAPAVVGSGMETSLSLQGSLVGAAGPQGMGHPPGSFEMLGARHLETAIEVREGYLYLLQELTERCQAQQGFDRDSALRELVPIVASLRNATLDCVEGIGRWEAGSGLQYVWQGVPYLTKLQGDLGFFAYSKAAQLLDFSVADNPLLVRSEAARARRASGALPPVAAGRGRDAPVVTKADPLGERTANAERVLQAAAACGAEEVEEDGYLATLEAAEKAQQQKGVGGGGGGGGEAEAEEEGEVQEDDWLTRTEDRTKEVERGAAVSIQMVYRGFRGRCRVREKRRRRAAALRLQGFARRIVARSAVAQRRRRRDAATTLQALHRGVACRDQVRRMRLEAYAAVCIQRTYRGHLGRRRAVQAACERHAARQIQSVWRGHRVRRTLASERGSLQTTMATQIQRCWRGHAARCAAEGGAALRVRGAAQAAVVLQAWARGNAGRAAAAAARERREAAVKLQAWTRGNRTRAPAAPEEDEEGAAAAPEQRRRKEEEERAAAATSIQAQWRGGRARVEVGRLRSEADEALDAQLDEAARLRRDEEHARERAAAAAAIQRAARGWLAGRAVGLLRARRGGAITIQRVERGRRARHIAKERRRERMPHAAEREAEAAEQAETYVREAMRMNEAAAVAETQRLLQSVTVAEEGSPGVRERTLHACESAFPLSEDDSEDGPQSQSQLKPALTPSLMYLKDAVAAPPLEVRPEGSPQCRHGALAMVVHAGGPGRVPLLSLMLRDKKNAAAAAAAAAASPAGRPSPSVLAPATPPPTPLDGGGGGSGAASAVPSAFVESVLERPHARRSSLALLAEVGGGATPSIALADRALPSKDRVEEEADSAGGSGSAAEEEEEEAPLSGDPSAVQRCYRCHAARRRAGELSEHRRCVVRRVERLSLKQERVRAQAVLRSFAVVLAARRAAEARGYPRQLRTHAAAAEARAQERLAACAALQRNARLRSARRVAAARRGTRTEEGVRLSLRAATQERAEAARIIGGGVRCGGARAAMRCGQERRWAEEAAMEERARVQEEEYAAGLAAEGEVEDVVSEDDDSSLLGLSLLMQMAEKTPEECKSLLVLRGSKADDEAAAHEEPNPSPPRSRFASLDLGGMDECLPALTCLLRVASASEPLECLDVLGHCLVVLYQPQEGAPREDAPDLLPDEPSPAHADAAPPPFADDTATVSTRVDTPPAAAVRAAEVEEAAAAPRDAPAAAPVPTKEEIERVVEELAAERLKAMETRIEDMLARVVLMEQGSTKQAEQVVAEVTAEVSDCESSLRGNFGTPGLMSSFRNHSTKSPLRKAKVVMADVEKTESLVFEAPETAKGPILQEEEQAAVTLQCMCRRGQAKDAVAARKRQVAEEAAAAERVEEAAQRAAAVRKIEKGWEVKRQRSAYFRAVVRIQAYFRAQKAQREARRVLQAQQRTRDDADAACDAQAQEAAAVSIQRCHRCKVARSELEERRHLREAKHRADQQEKSALEIQTEWRRHKARGDVNEKRKEHEVARSRAMQADLYEELRDLTDEEANALIRREMESQVEQNAAASLIQRCYRKYNASFMLRWKRETRNERRRVEREHEERQFDTAAAVAIQCMYRCWRARQRRAVLAAARQAATRKKAEEEERLERAAVAIQCAYRAYNARFEAGWRREKKKGLVAAQEAARLEEAKLLEEELARSEAEGARLAADSRAATKIQCAWRSYSARFNRRWRAEEKVERARRKKEAEEQEKAAVVIQRNTRMHQAQVVRGRRQSDLEHSKTLSQHAAATCIQCAARAGWARQAAASRRKARGDKLSAQLVPERQNRAAIKIQSMYRCRVAHFELEYRRLLESQNQRQAETEDAKAHLEADVSKADADAAAKAEAEAATRIQAQFKAKLARDKSALEQSRRTSSALASEAGAVEQEAAYLAGLQSYGATKIQAVFRGFNARNRFLGLLYARQIEEAEEEEREHTWGQ